jgi:hypothetical protein
MKTLKNFWKKTKSLANTVWTVLKYTLTAYTIVSVAFLTLTLTGHQNYVETGTVQAESSKLEDMSYKQWRDARAKQMMATDEWKDHMRSEAKRAIDMQTQVKSMSEMDKKNREWNQKLYGQDTVPETTN